MKRNSSLSSRRSAPPLELHLRPSWRERTLRYGVPLAALAALPLTALPVTWLALLALLLLLEQMHARRRPRYRALRLAGDGAWRLLASDGSERRAVPVGRGVVHPWLVLLDLRLEEGGRRLRVPIFPDALPRDQFKALQRHLTAA